VAVEGLALYGAIPRGVLADGMMGPRHVTTVTYENRPPVVRSHHVLNQWHVSGWLAKTLAWAGMTFFPFAGKDPRESARTLTDTSVLCIHGIDDPLLPFEGTLQVYEALPGTKQLWLIPEVSHPQEAALAQDGEYVAQLARFFHTALRGQQYRAMFRPLIRELSHVLHERRLHDLEALLYTLPRERPEAPFDFFLGVYCVQIMQRTRQKMPSLAQVAAQVLMRYWHYGPD